MSQLFLVNVSVCLNVKFLSFDPNNWKITSELKSSFTKIVFKDVLELYDSIGKSIWATDSIPDDRNSNGS